MTLSANSFGPAGGTATLQISIRASCTWSLATDDWIAPGRKTGEGSATVNFVVHPNPDGAERSGTITVGEQQLPVTQGGCSVSIASALPEFGDSGGTAVRSLGATPACRWTAQAADAWTR